MFINGGRSRRSSKSLLGHHSGPTSFADEGHGARGRAQLRVIAEKAIMESASASQTSIRSQETSAGPLPAYDVFLRALGDSYLGFFSER